MVDIFKTSWVVAQSVALLILCAGFVAAPHPTKASMDRAWNAWERGLRHQCPSRHVPWVGDGGYDELLDEFDTSLSRSDFKKLEAEEDFSPCREVNGFSCEMMVALDAYQRLGLMKRFVDFGCRHVRCEDIAVCWSVDLPKAARH